MNQKTLAEKLLRDNGMQYSKPVCAPKNTNAMTMKMDNDALDKDEATKYRSIVGNLLYIAMKTRSDTSITASLLSTRVKNPRRIVMVAAKRALRYLKGTTDKSIMIKPGHSDQRTAYIDTN